LLMLSIIDAVYFDNITRSIIVGGAYLNKTPTLKVILDEEAGMPGDISTKCLQGSSTDILICTFPAGLPTSGDYSLSVATNYPPATRYYETRYNLTIGKIRPMGPQGIAGP
ncbi:MAG: hypothetical protein ABI644_04470, partial [Arenimonas sp.]